MQIRTIVCPTDFSDPADDALAHAQDLARQFGARLIVLHVIEPVPVLPAPQVGTAPAFDVAQYSQALRDASERNLAERIDRLHAAGGHAESRLADGSVADAIVDVAAAEQADLIVIATQGRSGIKRFFLGSVADKVVHNATCPVLTIKAAT